MRSSLDRGYFDDFYPRAPISGDFRPAGVTSPKTSPLASLPPERFASAFEPGCAIGVLTSELAERCDRVLATDVSPAPLTIARRRLAGGAGVRLQRLRVPQAWPPGRFDLVVLSEIGYYCGTVDLTQLIAVASSSLTDDGLLPTAIGGIRWRTVR